MGTTYPGPELSMLSPGLQMGSDPRGLSLRCEVLLRRVAQRTCPFYPILPNCGP